MKKRRVKFIWGGSRVIKGNWFFGVVGLYDRLDRGRQEGIAISVRGLLLWLGAFAMILYVAAATTLFFLWHRNPYALQTYTDALFWPLRRGEVAAKSGRAFIAQGQDLARQNRWHDAAQYLRLGLARYPNDLRGRLTLARYYGFLNQRPLAVRVLTEGLTDEYPGRAYLTALLNAAEEADAFDFVASTAGRYIRQVDDKPLELRWLLGRRFDALMAGQRPAEALKLAEEQEIGSTGAEHRVLALLALRRNAEARDFLAAWRQQPRADLALVTRLEARVFREEGNFEEMERALTELRQMSHGQPEMLVYGAVQRAMAGRDTAVAAVDDYIFRFGSTPESLLMLAGPLAEISNVNLLQRVVTAAREHGFPRERFQMLVVQAHLQRAEWREAAAVFAEFVPPPRSRETAALLVWHDWMQRLVTAVTAPGLATPGALLEFLASRPWSARLFRESVDALHRSGRLEAAHEAVVVGLRACPDSKWLHDRLAVLKNELAAARVAEEKQKAELEAQRKAAEAQIAAELVEEKKAIEEAARKAGAAQVPPPGRKGTKDKAAPKKDAKKALPPKESSQE